METSRLNAFKKEIIFDELCHHAARHNMKILSESYISHTQKLKVRCVCGTIFMTVKVNITKGVKCENCMKYREILRRLVKYGVNLIHTDIYNSENYEIHFYIKCICEFIYRVIYKNKKLEPIKCPLCDVVQFMRKRKKYTEKDLINRGFLD